MAQVLRPRWKGHVNVSSFQTEGRPFDPAPERGQGTARPLRVDTAVTSALWARSEVLRGGPGRAGAGPRWDAASRARASSPLSMGQGLGYHGASSPLGQHLPAHRPLLLPGRASCLALGVLRPSPGPMAGCSGGRPLPGSQDPSRQPGGEFPERWGRGFWKREESRREQDRAPQIATLVLPRVRAAARSGGWKDPPGPRPPRGSHGHRSCGGPHFVTYCFPVFH